jgi:hypothetical protein
MAWAAKVLLASRLALLLAASPAGMFLGHVAAYRGMRAAGRRPTAHTSALAGIVLCFVALVAAAAAVAWADVTSAMTIAAATLIYVVATYAALSVLYLDIVNIAETSLHMHLLLEVAWDDRLSLARLIDKYSPAHMVGARLDRLTALGQVRRDGDRYYLGGNRSALMISRAVDAWRTVLGMPTSPAELGKP